MPSDWSSWDMKKGERGKKGGWIWDKWELRLGEMIQAIAAMVRKSRIGRKEFSRYLLCIKMHLSVRDWVKNWSILITFSLHELWFFEFNTSLNLGHLWLLDLFRSHTCTQSHTQTFTLTCTHTHIRMGLYAYLVLDKYQNSTYCGFGCISLAHSIWIMKMDSISLYFPKYTSTDQIYWDGLFYSVSSIHRFMS